VKIFLFFCCAASMMPTMPRAAHAQVRQSSGDCDYSVEVPAYTTGVAGSSVPWPMSYCHVEEGKPPASIVWTVTVAHCSAIHSSPDHGSLTINNGECREVPVSIPIPNDVCARSDATLNNASDGCDKHHEASGKLCILPTGEHSVHDRNEVTWAGDWAHFWGYLEPLTADFVGRTVRERRLSINDPCYRSSALGSVRYDRPNFLNDSTWTIQSGNKYGVRDTIGGGSLFPTRSQRDACAVVAQQAMEILCGDGLWYRYKVNSIRITIPAELGGFATVQRDNAISQ